MRSIVSHCWIAQNALGIAHRTHVEIGRWAEGIARLARDLGCGRVLLGANPRRALGDAALRFDLWLLRGALRCSFAPSLLSGFPANPAPSADRSSV